MTYLRQATFIKELKVFQPFFIAIFLSNISFAVMNSLKTYFLPLVVVKIFFHSVPGKNSAGIKRLVFSLFILASIHSNAQKNNEEYQKAIQDRSTKIVNSIGLQNSATYKKVQSTVENQYYQLNSIQEKNKTAIESIKKKQVSKEALDRELKIQDEKKSGELKQLHNKFLTLLKRDLSEEQVEKVKDAITYRILPITYSAYQDMIPNLTIEQKEKIYTWLSEARELAMDAESSEKKHAVFGKYKGRINNYLSAAGYDLKKEGDEWERRKKANASVAE